MIDRLASNLRRVRDRIDDACAAAGRSADDVTLVAVVKYAEMDWVRGLVSLDVSDLGEARPQQLAERVPLLAEHIQWHLIGSLQRNKARQTAEAIGTAGLIHSVDSAKLLRKLLAMGDGPQLLLQVNVTGEESKQGLKPEELPRVLQDVLDDPAAARIAGLMTMAAKSDDPDAPRHAFDSLRTLRDAVATSDRPLRLLSMGMSGDFEAAIAAGATHIRVGSSLFEGLETP